MDRHEKAAQKVWPQLVEAAKNEKKLCYEDIGKPLGTESLGVSRWYLQPIQLYCQRKNLPILSVLVVRKDTGEPGTGFDGVPREEIPGETQKCFNFDWDGVTKPTPEELKAAVENLPSCGIPGARQRPGC